MSAQIRSSAGSRSLRLPVCSASGRIRLAAGRRRVHNGVLRRASESQTLRWTAGIGASFLSISWLLTCQPLDVFAIPTSLRVYADSRDHEQSFVLFRGRPVDIRREGHSLRPLREDPSNGGEEPDPIDGRPKDAWNTVTDSLTGWKTGFVSLPDKLTDLFVPDWVRVLPGFVTKLQNELSMAPGSLAEEVWQEANDPEINPELVWDAQVRVSEELCEDEKTFLRNRKLHTRAALARYLDVPLQEIHPDDVPVIAVCGSGGGLRALVAGASSFLSAKEDGLFDCATYTAGVSGSCWLQALYYSTITGQNHAQLINHLRQRLGVHIANPPPAFALINSAPTNKYLLAGLVEKLKGVPEADFGIVDVYGLLLAARLFVPKGELSVTEDDLKLSNQRRFLHHGEHPLPIYTAVRHEIPDEEKSIEGNSANLEKAQQEDWFQWFEMTPFEFWCEELGAGIPTWAMGRRFDSGRTSWRQNGLSLPETRLPLLLGIWGSAFCATLSHYYQEVRPVIKNLAGFTGVDSLMMERDKQNAKTHVIDPAAIPNFVMGLQGQLPDTVPQSLFKEERLKLMDAGMSNNLPIYPLLRPGREVDVIISFDVSADARKDNWLSVASGYARQRGIIGWPVGAGWPPADSSEDQIVDELDQAHASTQQEVQRRLDDDADAQSSKGGKVQHEDTKRKKTKPPPDLTYCNVWVGSTTERTSTDDHPPSKLVSDHMELSSDDAGICVIYFPLLANPKVPNVDPKTAPYMSTWNFVYEPEDVDNVVALARANFQEGSEQTKRAVRAVWERKRRQRLEREATQKDERRRAQLRSGRGLGKKPGEGDHGDHFS